MGSVVGHRTGGTELRDHRSVADRMLRTFVRLDERIRSRLVALDPTSRTRRRVVRTVMVGAFSAVARGDLDLWIAGYEEDAVHEWSAEWVSLGQPKQARGRNEIHAAMARWSDSWETWTMFPEFVIDRGSHLVNLTRIDGRSAAAGIDVETELATVLDVATGLIRSEHDFGDWRDGLAFAGIAPEALGLLGELEPGGWTELPESMVRARPPDATASAP